MCSLAKLFAENSFASSLLNKVVTLRTKSEQKNEKESKDRFEISRNLLNLVRTQSISQPSLQDPVEKGIDSLQNFSQAERSVFFELIGCSLETFVVGDRVRQNPKSNQLYKSIGQSDALMVIMPYTCAFRGRNKVKVYSEAQGETIKVRKGDI